jgi:hypothetical protein
MVKAGEIRAAINDFPREVLRDALVLLLSEEKEEKPEAAENGKPAMSNFAQAVLYLKSRFSFPELDLFSTEGDLVYIQTNDRRILLTDRESTAGTGAVVKNKAPVEADHGRFSNLEFTDGF